MDEATAIHRRYAGLLVRVHPMTAPQGRPVIDVTAVATLAKLAERCGLLVLHWNRSGVETFIVQDENITYRYRPGASRSAAEPAVTPDDEDASATDFLPQQQRRDLQNRVARAAPDTVAPMHLKAYQRGPTPQRPKKRKPRKVLADVGHSSASFAARQAAILRKAGQLLVPKHPAQVIVMGFLLAILVGTGLLMLPGATPGPGGATFLEALFTATSAVCVTGLVTVDTPVFWNGFGQAVILALIQIGGFGVMSFSTLLGVLMARKLGLRSRMLAAAETKSAGFGDVRSVLFGVLKITVAVEVILAAVLSLRFALAYDYPTGEALWFGVFHSVSSFNNAGFALYSDSLMGFASDPWVLLPVAAAVIIGGLGFPVLFELRRQYRRPIHWSMNTKLVLAGSATLLAAGTLFLTAAEWTNQATLAGLSPGDRLMNGFFQSVITRTAGFNSIDISQLHPVSWMGMDILMFIGGGPAGTAGGLKITTFAVLFFILSTELRGGTAVNIFGKRLSRAVHRQAITVVLLAIALVVASTMFLMLITDFGQERILFEVISAFATVGLSTGITAGMPPAGQVVLILLMFIGRLGPVTLGTALALRSRPILFEYPKERPLIG